MWYPLSPPQTDSWLTSSLELYSIVLKSCKSAWLFYGSHITLCADTQLQGLHTSTALKSGSHSWLRQILFLRPKSGFHNLSLLKFIVLLVPVKVFWNSTPDSNPIHILPALYCLHIYDVFSSNLIIKNENCTGQSLGQNSLCVIEILALTGLGYFIYLSTLWFSHL